MRGRTINSIAVMLALALLPLAAQDGAGPIHPFEMAVFSQPGAPGIKHPNVVQPPVLVPPGPVPASKIKPAPPTPIAVKKAELGDDQNWNPSWDVLIEEHLPEELLAPEVARDVHPFCPRFNQLKESDKRAFWAYFFQALAGAEAGLKPTADVRHNDPTVAVRDTVTHRTVRQEGLLQLTYMDADRYGCNFDWDADKHLPQHDPDRSILQPENNLMCGIRILKNQLIDRHRPLVSSKSYWGTLHPGTLSFKVFTRQMANAPVACTAPVKTPRAAEPALRQASTQPPAHSPVKPVQTESPTPIETASRE